VHYACIDIPAAACAGLPETPCTLEIRPVMRAILADFERRGICYPATPEDRRMAQIVIDQLRQARAYASYLPSTTEPVLAPILAALQRRPGDKRGAAHWAATAGITERTLLRHCQQHLGMSFNDWRQRLRVVSALGMLDEGQSVQTVAHELGYSTPSAFIAMFQRLTGESPDSVRKRRTPAPV
jgi:AraC-like DNA-binding protein